MIGAVRGQLEDRESSTSRSEKKTMATVLSDAQIEQVKNDGYVSPLTVLPRAEAEALRARLETFEQTQGGSLRGSQRNKSFLLFSWLNELIRDARVLDPIEQIIGPNILCWNTIFWIKEAGSQSFVSWHQDTRYWGLSSDEVLTAWIALSPASEDSGCMRVMPRTHTGDVLPHDDRYDANNMLTRGQEISDGMDDSAAVYMPLETGQMSIHNYRLAHASGANVSNDRRIGISMHFMPTDTKQIVGTWDTAALVRGIDEYGHFEEALRPQADFDAAAVAQHERATEALNKILYTGAAVNTHKL